MLKLKLQDYSAGHGVAKQQKHFWIMEGHEEGQTALTNFAPETIGKVLCFLAFS
jgi:hypothetical protein